MSTYTQLTHLERTKIGAFLQMGYPFSKIGRAIGRAKSTVTRELARNSSCELYFPETAQKLSTLRRTEASSISYIDDKTWEYVEEKLKRQWSPDQISKRLLLETGTEISHETIYKYIYRDKKENGTLFQNLRHGKRRRKNRNASRNYKGSIKNRVSIDSRPLEINSRERLGDFEGDLIIGKNHCGKILTMVDRKSKLLIAKKLESKNAEHVSHVTIDAIQEAKIEFKSLTLDNGTEFSAHEATSKSTGVPIYFAHPYSSFERGTNENTNGLIRQYLPKSANLSKISEKSIEQIETLLNHRPRKSLNYLTPHEVHFGDSQTYFH